MKSDTTKIFRELFPWSLLTITFLVAVVISAIFNLSFIFLLGLIFLLIFGKDLHDAASPIRRHCRLRKALKGLSDQKLADWFVLDASVEEKIVFWRYLDIDSRAVLLREWNRGFYRYRRISEEKYGEAFACLHI